MSSNKIMFITSAWDILPKEEWGTLAAERLHCFIKIYTNVTDNMTYMALLKETATIEFDTEVVPEGNPRYPQRFKPVNNHKINLSDGRQSFTLVNLSDPKVVSALFIHEFTTDLSQLQLFDEFDPDKIKEISDEFARLTQGV